MACTQTKGVSIKDYYTTLTGLYDDLVKFKTLRTCECGHCTCDKGGNLVADRDEEILHQFLIRVDDDLYRTVLDEAYLAFVQEERSRNIVNAQAMKKGVQHTLIFNLIYRMRNPSPSLRDPKSRSSIVPTASVTSTPTVRASKSMDTRSGMTR